jgi:metal-sulfur cluster biosynthetic enzyme
VSRATLEAEVLGALDTVLDPELDRSLTNLGFAEASIDGQNRVTVELKLPTYWCAPNFAYLMVHDAREAVSRVPGVRAVNVRLVDHFAAMEITEGVAGDEAFDDVFSGLSDGTGLEQLRRLFFVKAFLASQGVVLRRLLREGRTPAEVCEMRLGALDRDSPETVVYLSKRERLGLPMDPAAFLAVLPSGEPVPAASLETQVRRARLTAVSLESNTALCRGLLETRYAKQASEKTPSPLRGGIHSHWP